MNAELIKTILRTMDKAANASGFKIALIDKSDGTVVGFDRLLAMVDNAFEELNNDNK